MQIDLGKIKMTWRGAYSATTEYEKDDVIENAGSSYIYINDAPSSGNPVTDTAHWQVMVRGANLPVFTHRVKDIPSTSIKGTYTSFDITLTETANRIVIKAYIALRMSSSTHNYVQLHWGTTYLAGSGHNDKENYSWNHGCIVLGEVTNVPTGTYTISLKNGGGGSAHGAGDGQYDCVIIAEVLS